MLTIHLGLYPCLVNSIFRYNSVAFFCKLNKKFFSKNKCLSVSILESKFFTNSKIYGADIDKDILFNNSRIQTYYCDQTNPDIIKKMWDEPALNDKFDFILDDGLHTFKANWCFFENSIHKLTRDGIYIIEDILNNEIPLFYDIINNEAKIKYPELSFSLLKIPSVINKFDNNLIIIKYNN